MLKVTHPFQQRRFRRISVSAIRASEKVQLSRIGSRLCAFQHKTHPEEKWANEAPKSLGLPLIFLQRPFVELLVEKAVVHVVGLSAM